MFEHKIVNIFYPSVLTYVFGAQKKLLNEIVLLSTHNICFGCEIRKLFFVRHFETFMQLSTGTRDSNLDASLYLG